MRRALISVFDKTGLDEFARGLADLGVDLVASRGSAAFIPQRLFAPLEKQPILNILPRLERSGSH